jgi:branched-chain amino acid transport system ATP-binding protein
MGVAQVLEGRRVLEHLTVEQNLRVGGWGSGQDERRGEVFRLFPALVDLRAHRAGYLSGGEQQMLVLGRAIMAKPRLLMLDEPSLGLAPMMVDHVYELIKRLNTELGISVLLVEQNARAALSVAETGYVLENGRVVLQGSAADLLQNEDLKEFYLGLGRSGERKGFRDVKHYRRRKRWLG